MINKKNMVLFCILLIIGLIALIILFPKIIIKPVYQFKDDTFFYSQNRGNVNYNLSFNYSNGSVNVYNVNFMSRNFMNYSTKIYGLIFLPNISVNVPGLVLLPGGAVTKESTSGLAIKIADLGYAVITIDQRGIGQTGGYYLSFDQDYQVFANGYEPIQQLSVFDALRTYDVLRSINGVDKNNIAVAGISMGGRYAIITAAQDKRLKGVLIISSSGFHFQKTGEAADSYLVSIDPDHYINKISPNQLFMLHGDNDTIINITDAQITFNLAKDPKNFFIANGCGHGYCDKMYDQMVKDLKILFGK